MSTDICFLKQDLRFIFKSRLLECRIVNTVLGEKILNVGSRNMQDGQGWL